MSTKPITLAQRELAARLLDIACQRFAEHGCNDFYLDNTDENWALIEDAEAWNGDDYRSERPPPDQKIHASDFFLMGYLSDRFGGDDDAEDG